MTKTNRAVAASLAAAWLTAASPSAADEAGARELRAALEAYFGQTAFETEALKISPEGAGYRLSFDVAPLLAAVTLPVGAFSMNGLSMLVAPRPDGDWDVSGNDPFRLAFEVREGGRTGTVSYDIGPSPYTGIWSTALRAFSWLEGRTGAGTVTIRDGMNDTDIRFGEGTVRATAFAAANGDIDSTMRQSVTDFQETLLIPGAEDGSHAALEVTIEAERIDVDSRVAAMRYAPMLDIWSFIVTNADGNGERIKARQEELRGKLRALLPMWRWMESTATLRDVRASTDMGAVGFDTLSYGVVLDGVGAASDYTFETAFAGLEAQSPLIPDWAAAIMPQDVKLGITVHGIDLATPAGMAIDTFDLSNPDLFTPEQSARMAATFEGRPANLLIEPSYVSGEAYRVDFGGELTVLGEAVDMTATVIATGLDSVVAAIQEAKTPEAFQAAGAISFARGFGRQMPDGRIIWNVVAKADGSVEVNGVMVSPPRN